MHKRNRNPDDGKKELDGQNADEGQDPRNRARSMQIEELSIHSQGDKTKSNKTSSARQILHLELKALKEQEELQARLTKLKQM